MPRPKRDTVEFSIRLQAPMKRRLEARAAAERRTLNNLIEGLLLEAIGPDEPASPPEPPSESLN
jgi:predicted HicB family RNase H-like nuclease